MWKMQARDVALEALNRPDSVREFPLQHLERVLRQDKHVTQRDRAFIYNLVQGVFRWRLRLDWIIKQSVNFPFRTIEPPVLNVLRMALYQIFFMDRVPQSAAVNEAVKQAKAVGKGPAAGFVNGILRRICRQKDKITFPDKKEDPAQYLSVFYSYPSWLVKKWMNELGTAPAERLLDAGNQIPDLVIRTNSLKIDRTGLIGLLEDEGVVAGPTKHSPDGVRLEGLKGGVVLLEAFKKGLFQVQGEAPQICSHLLNPVSGDSVLDLCAGLGGKSTHLAELMGGKGRVVSLDISHDRLVMLLDSVRRLEINGIHPVVANADTSLGSLKKGRFDKILVDAPCSGLGIISKHPDGKWSRDESDIKRLARLQERILNRAVPLIKSRGTMLYVTCTVSREENERVVSKLLTKNPGIILENLKDHAPDWAMGFIDNQGFFKTLPHLHGMDGFFAALFRKG
jgi:16S rRNA (cytosine967-C5)-methyltransferase